jgi:hypothetical protein
MTVKRYPRRDGEGISECGSTKVRWTDVHFDIIRCNYPQKCRDYTTLAGKLQRAKEISFDGTQHEAT